MSIWARWFMCRLLSPKAIAAEGIYPAIPAQNRAFAMQVDRDRPLHWHERHARRLGERQRRSDFMLRRPPLDSINPNRSVHRFVPATAHVAKLTTQSLRSND
jgi:hypothetical protein